MKKLLQEISLFWDKPHPFIFNAWSVLIPVGITFLLILFFSPFSFNEVSLSQRVYYGFIISIIVGVSIFLIVSLLRKYFPKIISEDNWTIGREFLLFILVLIGISFLIFLSLYFFSSTSLPAFSFFLKTCILTFSISIIPIIVTILFEQFHHHKIQLTKTIELNKELEQANSELIKLNSQNEKIKLHNESNEVDLILPQSDLLMIKSEGNYLEVFYLKESIARKHLIRNRLKNILEDLPTTQFIRCHNRYIVNIGKIQKVEGNARNLSIIITEISDKIPVSRSNVQSAQEMFKSLGH